MPNKAHLRSDAIAARVARMIENGEYPPGSRLPPERQLAETAGVSRTAVREALRSLTAIGLVEAHVGKGRFVTSDAPARRSRVLVGQLLDLHRGDLTGLSAVRELLEAASVREIPFSSLPDVAAQVRSLLREAHVALEDSNLDLLARLDSEFHSIPLEYCQSRPLRALALGVVVAMGQFTREVLRDPRRDATSLDQHEQIVRAFESNDRELAAVLIGRHQSSAIRSAAEAQADRLERLASVERKHGHA